MTTLSGYIDFVSNAIIRKDWAVTAQPPDPRPESG